MTRWHSPPAELYAVVEHTPASVLLESARPAADSGADEPDLAAWSTPTRLFTHPVRVLTANHPADLPSLFAEIERAVSSGLYAAGYFAYECGAFFEPTTAPINLPIQQPAQPLAQPLAWFGVYQHPHLFDHRTGKFLDGDPPALAQFRTDTDAPPEPDPEPGMEPDPDPDLDWVLGVAEQQYAQHIYEIHALIRSGDVYQLNFTIPIHVHAAGSSAALYRRLRTLQPAPYGAFLHTEQDHQILSFSPELFFRLESGPAQNLPPESKQANTPPVPHPCDFVLSQGWESTPSPGPINHPDLPEPQESETTPQTRRITTRPMKGTAPRSRTTAEDRTLADWLRNDPKNRAENVMIVDLLRNDLGRLCSFGSVQVHDLFAVERYPTLWQMTSTVTGQLRPEVGFQDIFRALFPCGSVTGAPKIRAMQLLAQLEARPRGVYTGAIGFFSKNESVFNVAIRTLSLRGDHGTMSVGSGIVIDSNPADEWRECLLKAEFLTRPANPATRPSPQSFSLLETLLWQGDYPLGNYPLIELHLDRLQDSADYFAFPFKRAEVRAALETHANSLTSDPRAGEVHSPSLAHKVRLLLNPGGSLEITSEPIQAPSTDPLRVRIAPQRTDPSDPMYFHKTTHRPLYAQAFQAAIEAGYDDVLFLNNRGEVTEAAIHNIFIEKAGRLLTPPIQCGLLPGVHRRHILATNLQARESILTEQDLRQADAIYLSNAVRALRPAKIDWQNQ